MNQVASAEADELPARVRAANGQTRDDAWVQRRVLPLRQRVVEAARFAAGGLLGGLALLVVPLVHLLGVVCALGSMALAVRRLRTVAVLDDAGGTCPRCGRAGRFFIGWGRRRFRLPTTASCEGCGIDLTLQLR